MDKGKRPPVTRSNSERADNDGSARRPYLRLVVSFLTIVLPLVIVAAATAYVARPVGERQGLAFLGGLLAALFWPPAYLLARAGRRRLATWLLILSGATAAFVGGVAEPESNLLYLLLPILFASFVLPARSVLAFAAANLVAVAILGAPVYQLTLFEVVSIVIFLTIGSILLFLGTRYREELEQKRQRSLQARTEDLERANAFIGAIGRVSARISRTTDLKEVFTTLDRELHRLNINYLITLEEAADGEHATRLIADLAADGTPSERRLRAFLERLKIPQEQWTAIEQFDPRRAAFVEDVPALLQTLLPDLRPSLVERDVRAAGITPQTDFAYLPLITDGSMMGVIFLWATTVRPVDLPALSAFASQVAVAIDNARLVRELESTVAKRTAEIAAERDQRDAVLRTVADAIITVNEKWRIQYANPAFTRMTGFSAEELEGRPIRDLVRGWMTPRQMTAIREAITRGEDWKGEVRIQRKNGRSYDAQMTVAAMRDGHGRLVGYVSTHHDISHYKELDRARRRFIRDVSHELNTPVTSIRLYVDLLRQGPPEKHDHYVEILRGSVDRLHRLVADTLEMTRIDAGQAVKVWEPLSLAAVFQNAVASHEGRAEAAGVRLDPEPPPLSLPVVYGDAARLSQAIGELVENAINFCGTGDVVTIVAEARERDGNEGVALVVADTGPGILPAEQQRIFDRFHRGTVAESGDIPGSGLGLSMVRAIVHAHGGSITVDSEPGEGSAFSIWLPGAGEGPAQL